jgi:arylsulfatase A-like enzyme
MKARPNILWIVTTQWRAQALGYAGDGQATTPHLDRLAARSLNFRQAVTPHPFGPFARAAMWTGVRSPENGVRDYYDPLPTNARTVAHDLDEAGYATAYLGKWHLWKRDPVAPLVGAEHARLVVPPEARGGFKFWEGFESGFLLNDPWLHGTRLPEPKCFVGYQSDILCERGADWINAAPAGPWCCVVSLEAPHPPYDAPTPGGSTVPPAELVLRANVPNDPAVQARVRRELLGYYAHIRATDAAIGRLLERVNFDTTVVMFTSVHGDMHGSHGLFRKGWPHEESVRVPLLVAVPGETPAVRDEAVSLIDLPEIVRTLSQGGRLSIAREKAEISMPSVVRLPHQCDRVWHGWRSAREKQVFNADGSLWYACDLVRDPLELTFRQ